MITTQQGPVHLVWFKRDLRAEDHAPLRAAAASGCAVLPLYVVEPDYWVQPFASRRQWGFIHGCLQELRDQTARLGQPLVVRTGAVTDIIAGLAEQLDITAIHTHQETGNSWTYARDKVVAGWCRARQIELVDYPFNGIVRGLSNRDKWSGIRSQRMTRPVLPPPAGLRPVHGVEAGPIPAKTDRLFGPPLPGSVQPGGRQAGLALLDSFLVQRARTYQRGMSSPLTAAQVCSRLSPHLSWGTFSPREIEQAVSQRRAQLGPQDQMFKRSLSSFSSRLVWRCHFMQKLEDQPDLDQHCMHQAFEGLREPHHNEAFFTAWCAGQTGYPFIDACMRSLVQTGWLNFRMRAMLVSFAAYHLWLDWRRFGPHLARQFTDYEPGIHYSQLQMQSGVTGINTLRIYNPVKQSYDQDPEGRFIRKWVPELAGLSPQWVHEPWKLSSDLHHHTSCRVGQDYPFPLVENETAMKQARTRMAEARKTDGFADMARQVFRRLGSRNRPPQRRTRPAKTQLSLFEE